MDKKFYGLVLNKKVQKLQSKTISIFDSDDDDVSSSAQPTFKSSSNQSAKNKNLEKKLAEEDPTIFEYDSIYDSMKGKATDVAKTSEKKQPRYIDSLLKAATKRKKDYEIRVEKKIQLDRSKEGDEFAGKESFVTSAYKQKLVEMEAEQEKELLQSQLDEMMDVTKQKDLSGFYRHYLKQSVGEEKVPEFGNTNLMKTIKKENIDLSKQDEVKKSAHSEEKSYSKLGRNVSASPEHSGDERHDIQPSLKLKVDDRSNKYEKNRSSHKPKSDETRDSKRREPPKDSSDDDTSYYHQKLKSHGETSKEADEKSKHSRSAHSKKESSKSGERASSTSHLRTANSPKKLKQKDGRHSEYDIDSNRKREMPKQKTVLIPKDVNNEDENISHGDTKSVDNKSTEKGKDAKNGIQAKFAKRTVGVLFDQAQARYFERMATRNMNSKG